MNETTINPGMDPTPANETAGNIATVPDLPLRRKQEAFLLKQLASRPDKSLGQTEANKIPQSVLRDLKLTKLGVNRIRDELVAAGYVRREKRGRALLFAITDAGEAYLRTLPEYVASPVGGRIPLAPITTDARLLVRQEAFLLQQLADAPNGKLRQGEVNRSITKLISDDLQMSLAGAGAVLNHLAERGYISGTATGKTCTYELTDDGMAYLNGLDPYVPPPPSIRGPIVPAPNDTIAANRTAYLLLQLLQADGRLSQQEAGKTLNTLGKQYLALNPATAQHLRRELAGQGLIEIERSRKTETYTLTEEGRLKLGSLSLYEGFDYNLRGRVLNRLLEAARDAAKQFEPSQPTASPTARPRPSQAELSAAVMSALEHLLREKYHTSGLVPVYEVRRIIRERFGEAAGTHEVLDPILKNLRSQQQLRFVPISDLSKATEQQLQDSIPGVGETLFYLEVAHEAAVL